MILAFEEHLYFEGTQFLRLSLFIDYRWRSFSYLFIGCWFSNELEMFNFHVIVSGYWLQEHVYLRKLFFDCVSQLFREVDILLLDVLRVGLVQMAVCAEQ